MSTSTIKMTREGKNIEDENQPEESSANSPQEILGNGDTVIFSTLISLMEDLELLKTCRLVCKSWNEFACRALRKLPWVFTPIHEYYSDSEDAEKILKIFAENKNLGLPSPFANFKVYAQGFREESFPMFLKYLRENANNYSIDLRFKNETDAAELQTVLTTNLHNFKITKLVLCAVQIEDGPDVDIFQPDQIRLPHLQTLKIKDDALASESMVIFCETLCHYSPIKFLQIGNNHEGEALKKVLSPGGMKSVENFRLSIGEPISEEDFHYICARIMEIPCLKRLTMGFPRWPSYGYGKKKLWYMDGFKTIIEHFANSLESLIGSPLPTIHNKCFPKLSEIHNAYLTSEYEFSYPKERYPLLKKATFLYAIYADDPSEDPLHIPSVEEGITGIEELNFSGRVHFQNAGEVMKLMGAAGTVCPNVTTFFMHEMGGFEFSGEMLKVISKSVPKVRSLELRVNIRDDRTLSGLRESADDCFENLTREPSLLDFPDLEKLSLGPDVVITGHLFKHCLSKLPKLRYLSFYLNEFVSAEEVLESVGHLTRIRVVILKELLKLHEEWVKEIEELREMFPAVVEIKYPLYHRKRFDDDDFE